MAKRFTDTQKWQDEWYLSLSNDNKIVWQYILDACSNAGVLKKNMKMLNFCCSTNLDEDSFTKIFAGRAMDVGKYWFVPKFLKFQYPKGLNSNKPIIISIRKELENIGLTKTVSELLGNDFLIINESLDNDKTIINQQLDNHNLMIKDKEKDKDKEKEKDLVKGEFEGEKPFLCNRPNNQPAPQPKDAEWGQPSVPGSKKALDFELRQLEIGEKTEKATKRLEAIRETISREMVFYITEQEIIDLRAYFEAKFQIFFNDQCAIYGRGKISAWFKDFESQNNQANWKNDQDLRKHLANFFLKKQQIENGKNNQNGAKPKADPYRTSKRSYANISW